MIEINIKEKEVNDLIEILNLYVDNKISISNVINILENIESIKKKETDRYIKQYHSVS